MFNPLTVHKDATGCSLFLNKILNMWLDRSGSYGRGPDLSIVTGLPWGRLMGRCLELARSTPSNPEIMQAHLSLFLPFAYTIPTTSSPLEFVTAFLDNKVLNTLSGCMRLFSPYIEASTSRQSEQLGKTVQAMIFGQIVVRTWCEFLGVSQLHSEAAWQQSVSEDMLGCFEQTCLLWIQSPRTARQQVDKSQYSYHCPFLPSPVTFAKQSSSDPHSVAVFTATMTEGNISVFLVQLKSRPELFIAAASQVSRGSKRITTDASAPREIKEWWTDLDEDVLELFAEMGDVAKSLPRCGEPSCGRAWSDDGSGLLKCARCHARHYCSRACQRAYVDLHYILVMIATDLYDYLAVTGNSINRTVNNKSLEPSNPSRSLRAPSTKI